MESRDFNIINSNGVNWFFYRDKTILVTGSTGRIGRYIIESLIDADLRYNLNLRIIGVARNHVKVQDVFADVLDFPNISFLFQDINDSIQYTSIVDYVFHTAGPSAPKDYEVPVETLWAHVNGTRNVLEFARIHGVKRVFYISTVETYGEWKSDKLLTEDDMGPLKNNNSRACYPEAKRLCETMLASYKEEYGIDFCGVHLCHTLGPGIVLDDGRGFAEFLRCVLNGDNIVLHSDGSAMRTYTYTADAVNAIFLIMEKGKSGVLYNVASNENLISIKDLAELIASMSQTGQTRVLHSNEAVRLKYLPFKLAIMDTRKVRELGWKPQVDIRTMFKWTLDSFL